MDNSYYYEVMALNYFKDAGLIQKKIDETIAQIKEAQMGIKVKAIPKQENPYTKYLEDIKKQETGTISPVTSVLKSEPIVGITTATKNGKSPDGESKEELLYSNQEILNKGQIVESLYRIEVGGGQTINIGNYESVRIDCRLTVPVGSKDELNDAYEFASNWISEKLVQAIKDAKGE